MAKKFALACVLLGESLTWGQTQVNLNQQSKDVDFSSQPLVRPFRMGSTLPSTCQTGEMFFNTSAAAGANAYGCVATNTWALEGQGSGAGGPVTAPIQVARTSSTVLTIGGDCSASTPCSTRNGAVVHSISSAASATITAGSGLAFLYINNAGALTVGIPSGITSIACTGCQVAQPITQFPVDSIPLVAWNATSGTWDASGTDFHALLSTGRSFTAGTNVSITEAGSNVTIAAIGYNTLDMTSFDRTHVFSEFGYSGAAPWAFTSGCGGVGGTAGVAGEPGSLGWSATGGACFVFYPGDDGGAGPFNDFVSGSTPANYTLIGRYGRGTPSGVGSGDHYVGWDSAKDGTVVNFVGARYLNSAGQWQCVIRTGGTDAVAQPIAVTPDAAVHTISVTNGGVANSVTCKIDSTSLTVTETIPASSWYGVMGSTIASGSTYDTTIEARIHIGGIVR